jgi:hypothetical protein
LHGGAVGDFEFDVFAADFHFCVAPWSGVLFWCA